MEGNVYVKNRIKFWGTYSLTKSSILDFSDLILYNKWHYIISSFLKIFLKNMVMIFCMDEWTTLSVCRYAEMPYDCAGCLDVCFDWSMFMLHVTLNIINSIVWDLKNFFCFCFCYYNSSVINILVYSFLHIYNFKNKFVSTELLCKKVCEYFKVFTTYC